MEKEAGGSADREGGTLKKYWDALLFVCNDEIEWVKGGGVGGAHESVNADIKKMFQGQSSGALKAMREDISVKIRSSSGVEDGKYWRSVLAQLDVHLAKEVLSAIHEQMLTRQLEELERRQKELKENPEAAARYSGDGQGGIGDASAYEGDDFKADLQEGDIEEALGIDDEVNVGGADGKYNLRKPRYFNRVKTGWDWNKYNQTHYDHENPPPKVVQGYKFSIFYPDLVDKSVTPQFFLEPTDSQEFCIIRFHAGRPYEDIAFKILNKEWAKSRKRGYKCTFDRGVLTLFFNFNTHWYRR